MTRSGADYLSGIEDGRRVFIDGEQVVNVARHPAFRGAVRSIAACYDLTSDPSAAQRLCFESPRTGRPVSRAFQIPLSEGDLTARRIALKSVAEVTFGLIGRGPEHVASFLAGFAGASHVFAEGGKELAENLVNFYERARDDDLYVTYTILPPQIDRSKPAHQQADPFLYAGVKEERDGGIVLAGAQMLGTGTALSDYVYLSCISPLVPGDEAYAIACVVPVSAPGVRVHARRAYALGATSVFDYPLSTRFDESDSLVVFDDVFVPWEHVFAYRNIEVVRDQWTRTPGHLLGNNQAQIRFWTKLDLLLGLARRVAEMNGSDRQPAVRGALGEMAAHAAMVAGLVLAQEQHCRLDENGVAWPGIAECFANIALQSELYPKLVTMVRDLCGGGAIQLPSSANDYASPEIAADLERYVQSPGYPSLERVKLLKLVWDLVGSEFASRHLQYEMFYAGAPFITKMRMFEGYDWSAAGRLVDRALAGYDLGGTVEDRAGASSAAGRGDELVGQDLRSAFAALEAGGRAVRVASEIDWRFEAAAVLWELAHGPAVLFENVRGYDTPLVGNLLNTRDKLTASLGIGAEDLTERFGWALEHRVAPRRVESGECQAVVRSEGIDLTEWFPVPMISEHDAGRYISAGILIARDPLSGRQNWAICRLQVQAPDRLGINMAPTHSWQFYLREVEHGRPMEVAVAIGCHPVLLAASQLLVPFDEAEAAGGLFGEPLETVQATSVRLEVPAWAEIVLEGAIEAETRREEGPFGELAGLYATARPNPVLSLRAVTHRQRPWLQMIVGGRHPEHLVTGAVAREATLLAAVRAVVPGALRAVLTEGGSCRFHAVVAIDQRVPGEAKLAITAALSSQDLIKHVTVVDADIDPSDSEQVEWAVATRFRPDDDLVTIRGMKSNPVDPMSRDRTITKLGIDATLAVGAERNRPLVDVPAEVRHSVRRRWAELLGDVPPAP